MEIIKEASVLLPGKPIKAEKEAAQKKSPLFHLGNKRDYQEEIVTV